LRAIAGVAGLFSSCTWHLLHVHVPTGATVNDGDDQKSADQDIAAAEQEALRSARTLLEAAGIFYSCKVVRE